MEQITFLPDTPKKGKALGSKYYFTGKTCSKGHVAERLVSTRVCVECNAERYRLNRIQITEDSRKRYADSIRLDSDHNKKRYESSLQSQKTYRLKNKETRNRKSKDWYAENTEYAKAYAVRYRRTFDVSLRREQGRKSYRRNKETFIANAALRRAAKLERTPKWLTNADRKAIREIYAFSAAISKVTGTSHHVDHIVPLQGELVSGLHVPGNLQVLTAQANLLKSNTFGGECHVGTV